ncbi:hypothetical protein LTR56_007764 [Elasticomyces elasticus]|nr:hypothetical protein LTR56_007764 [Elasticomyces elasticus]KAK3661864.1 hypothetical protein LTR22_007238 [Elasticomyces elasticus]KAK4925623.1 hypothetical protein LTR49_007461 [Elasticomyces elasticus]KAK5748590.1 hypothetical protein LTS12_021364 [Elasticomyces elasticus]
MAVDRITSIEALTLQDADPQDICWDDVEFVTTLDDTVMTMTGCLLGDTPPTSLDQGYVDTQHYLSYSLLELHGREGEPPASEVQVSPSHALLGHVHVDTKDQSRLEALASTTTSRTVPVLRKSMLRSAGHATNDLQKVRSASMRQVISSTQAIKAKRTQQNREAQRAFRERRASRLQELESQAEKALSDLALMNAENGRLHRWVFRTAME